MPEIIKFRGLELDLDRVSSDLRRAWRTAPDIPAVEVAGAAIVAALGAEIVIKNQKPGVLRADGLYPAAAVIAKVTSAADLRK